MLPGSEFFHVGIVVPELEPAVDEFTALFGYEWMRIPERTLRAYETEHGFRDISLAIAFSVQKPHIELIEARPGTPWEHSETGSNIHHLAFFIDDLGGVSEELSARYSPIEICGVAEDGTKPTTFSYHARGGIRFELCPHVAQTGAWHEQ